MDILLLAKDFINKEEMVLTAFVVDSRVDVKILDIQPLEFKEYYEEALKQSIKQKKLKEFINDRRKTWFYKSKDLS